MTQLLPHVNASMNALAALFLLGGYVAIRSGRQALHWKLMAAAAVASTLFLAGYLTYHALGPVLHHYAGPGRPFYLALLLSHTILAAVALPLILRTLWLSAVRRSYAAHRRIAVWMLPVWGYVSVTGVIVYWMLYRL
jgi:putative membrane protein